MIERLTFSYQVPPETRKANKEKIKEIMEITEKLKQKLLQVFEKEYEQYLEDQERERKKAIEEAKRKELEDARNKLSGGAKSSPPPSYFNITPSAPELPDLQGIVYPNDFPSADPQKSSGLLPGNKPSFDRATKPSLSFVDGGLRTVRIPEDTMQKFLDVSKANTLKNVETCGILAGSLKQQQLLVTHVILPKQSGTSDSCNTHNEEEIFEIQDQLNLITLGNFDFFV